MRPTLPLCALVTLSLGPLAGCTCGGTPTPRTSRESTATGGESRPAIAYPTETPAPAREAFERIEGDAALAALAVATRAGSWAGTRRGGEERRSAGNFLCRLETAFGPAPIREPGRVAYVLRARESELVLTAVADASGPWLGARNEATPQTPEAQTPEAQTPEAQTRAAEAVIELARLLDATVPDDCAHTIDGVEVGVRAGEWF